MNMLQNGLQWLSAKQKKHVSSKIVYCRGNEEHSVDAVFGRTRFESIDEHAAPLKYGNVTAHTIAFFVAASLPPSNCRSSPKAAILSLPEISCMK